MNNSRETWLKIFKDLKERGKIVYPRGLKTLELEDYVMKFHPINDRIVGFKERNFSLKYGGGELAWYLTGDPNDTRIEHYSKFWLKVKNKEEPLYNSNYGYYLFKEGQFDYVIDTLKEDKDSRQAVIILCRANIMMSETKDKICTYSIFFRIRENKLNMSISMRSSDLVRGICIDVYEFSIFYEMVYWTLKEKYKDLEFGTYVHKSDSLHLYETHFNMLEAICNSSEDTYNINFVPKMNGVNEVNYLRENFPRLEWLCRTEGITSHKQLNLNEYNFTKWALSHLK